MYRNCYYDSKEGLVYLRTWTPDGDRIDTEIPYKPYLYVEREDAKDGLSIFKTPLFRKNFKNSYERKEYVKFNPNERIFNNLPVEQQYLIDEYYDKIDDKDFSKFALKVFYIDIETKCNRFSDQHKVEVKRNDGEISTVCVGDLLTLDKDSYTVMDEETKEWSRIMSSCYQTQEFPNPSDAKFPVLLITVYDSISNEYHTWGVKDYTPTKSNVYYHKCDSEFELLDGFIKHWKRDHPDILVGWNCISKNQYIWNTDKIIKFGDVKKGSKLFDANGDSNKVVDFKDTGNKDEYCIETEFGNTIFCSNEHIFPICKKGRELYKNQNSLYRTIEDTKLKNIDLNDDCYIVLNKRINNNQNLTYKKYIIENFENIKNYEYFDFIIKSEKIRNYLKNTPVKEIIKPEYWHSNKFWRRKGWNYKNLQKYIPDDMILEYISGESVIKFCPTNGGGFDVDIDEIIDNDILKFIGFTFTDGCIDFKEFSNTYSSVYKEVTEYYTDKYNKIFNKQLKLSKPQKVKDGCYYKSLTVNNKIGILLPFIYDINNKKKISITPISMLSYEQFKSFYSGLVDGDGCFSNIQKTLGVCNSIEENLSNLQQLLLWNNVISTKTKTLNRIPFILENESFLRGLDIIHPNRKIDGGVCFFEKCNNSSDKIKYFIKEDNILVKIRKIYKTETPTEMADIETSTHYFVCNGIKTHNCDGFDVPYIINRITNVMGEAAAKRLSPFRKLYSSNATNDFGQQFIKWHIQGVSILDYMLLYKTFARDKRESYKLNYIGEVELNEGKLEINATNLSTLADTDWKNFVEYNIQDVALLVKLEEKLKYIQIARLLSYQGCSNFESALGKVTLVVGAIAIQAKKEGLTIPTFPPNLNGELPGGFVREPITGLQEAIVSFDANSLYPNTIITLNISPETKVGKLINNPDFNNPDDVAELVLVTGKSYTLSISKLKKFLISEQMCISNANVIYSQKNKGIIPKLVDDLYTKRVDAKAKYKKIDKKKMKTDEDEYELIYLDTLQYTVKIFLNSLYGAFANNYCIFADIDAARSVTATGRAVGQEAANIVDRHAKEKYGVTGKSIVVYGDTDSVAFDSIIRHKNGEDTIEKLWENNDNIILKTSSGHEMKHTNGIEILTYKNNIPVYGKIKHIIRHKVTKKRYKITVDGKSVVITEDHDMVVVRNDKLTRISPKEIAESDKILYISDNITSILKTIITDKFKVEQLDVFDDEYVYDFEMDTENPVEQTYFANDILVHNSIYLTVAPILDIKNYKLLEDNGDIAKDAAIVIDEIDNVLNDEINVWAKRELHTTDPRFVFKREVIADAGVFLMKKRYILHINDKEGKKTDEFKYVGVEVAKSTISKEVKEFIKRIMNTLLSLKTLKSTNEVYIKVYDDFKQLSLDDMAFRISVNNYEKYAKTSTLTKFESGTPVHVKAAIAYNLLLKLLKIEDKYERINSNQKVKWVYLKKNVYGLDAIAYPSEYPKEFTKLVVDKEKMFEKQILPAIERLYDGVNWMMPDVCNQTTTNLFDLFSD